MSYPWEDDCEPDDDAWVYDEYLGWPESSAGPEYHFYAYQAEQEAECRAEIDRLLSELGDRLDDLA